MRNGKDTNSCLFGEELVGYIYDELLDSERSAFEGHLLTCSGCTAELADVSVSRLGVFEWHRDEFLPLATPQFAIPYEPIAITPNGRVSFLDSVRSSFVSPFRVAFAGSAFAALFVVATFAFMFSGYSDSEIVAGNAGSAVPPIAPSVIAEPELGQSVFVPATAIDDKRTEPRQYHSAVPVRKTNVIQAKATATRKNLHTVTANTQNAPRLGNFAEPEDTSLRLADLVADIDTKD